MQSAFKSVEAMVTSPDVVVVYAGKMTVLPPAARQRLADAIKASKVNKGGIEPGEASGNIPAPPMPYPDEVLWFFHKSTTLGPDTPEDKQLAVLMVFGDPEFAVVNQPKHPPLSLYGKVWKDLTARPAAP